jgi:Ca2+-binding RTX toxin-like protein
MGFERLSLRRLAGVVGGATTGDDSVVGTDGGDGLFGDEGNDTLVGGGGRDLLLGGAGRDLLSGGGGEDALLGGGGDDAMEGGYADHAADLVLGEAGNDGYLWARDDGDDHFDGGEGRDTLTLLGIGFEELRDALSAAGIDPRCIVLDEARGAVSFVDAAGNPLGMAGELRFGKEAISFANLERIQVWG